jgi:hypothetical protein
VGSEFDAQAGVPTQKTVQFSPEDLPFDVGGGTIELGADMISVMPAETAASKSSLAYQDGGQVSVCLDACALAGVDATTCSNVCESGELAITIWAGPVEDIVADCESGDEYRFRVTLDEESQPVTVTVSPSSLQPATRALLNSGADIGLCIEVISPIDATVLIDTLTLRLSL